ncbi:MAG TPA: AzlC family ABC transporter permease [Burkholderiaceae bacterium]|nr:AzlC family ABC transporter permease [Burkholderiaceae bacterium]
MSKSIPSPRNLLSLEPVRRAAFVAGLRRGTPLLIPTAIWGLVAGVAMVKTGLTTLQALAMTLFVYAGSAQMAVLPLIAAGAPVWIALLTATIVNLRFVIFSATLWPYFGHLSLARRLLLGFFAVDMTVAIFVAHQDSAAEPLSPGMRWFYLGIAVATWVTWQSSSIAGILLAGLVPARWGLEFAAILALIVMTAPMFQGRPAIAGCIAAGTVAVLAAALPLKLGLVLAVIAGVAVAMATDLVTEQRAGEPR